MVYNSIREEVFEMETSRHRTSLPDATRAVLRTLETTGESLTVSNVVQSTGLHRRTVEKAVDEIMEIQRVLKDKKVILDKVNKMRVLRLEERSGMLSLPDHIQKIIIRSLYFPTPSREEEILVHLYLRDATNKRTAMKSEEGNRLTEKLLRQGQILSTTDKRIYLSKEGFTVAKGALDTYPELMQILHESKEKK